MDTNVLISAAWREGSVPDLVLGELFTRQAVVLLDARLVEEYANVLARPKFSKIDPLRKKALLERLLANGEHLHHVPAYEGSLPDADDRAFVEVALAGRADVLMTGNVRDYPATLGFDVLPPATLLARLELGA